MVWERPGPRLRRLVGESLVTTAYKMPQYACEASVQITLRQANYARAKAEGPVRAPHGLWRLGKKAIRGGKACPVTTRE